MWTVKANKKYSKVFVVKLIVFTNFSVHLVTIHHLFFLDESSNNSLTMQEMVFFLNFLKNYTYDSIIIMWENVLQYV